MTRFARWLWTLGVVACTTPAPVAPPAAPVRAAPPPSPAPASEQRSYALIPAPVELVPDAGAFVLDANTRIVVASGDPRATEVAHYLARLLRVPTGLPLRVESAKAQSNAIALELDASIQEDEGYRLAVTPSQITLTARQAQGLFYGVQTLRQLAPVQLASQHVASGVSWSIPALRIRDYPRFPYRGMHLDVGRHFFPVEFVKAYIDRLASYKMNTFHWHLTEDQGWRIEIQKYPKLTEVGGFRRETLIGHNRDQPHKFDGTRYGGFYTQDEVREVVAYARERFVDVIPEIELPGHSLAALAAYPELGCTPGPFEVARSWGIFEDVFCPKEGTFQFLEQVLSEVIALFPSRYVHIGGDEVPKVRWKNSPAAQQVIRREKLKDENELQSYFIRRIEKFLNDKGRRLLGWDEILEGGLAPRATVMSWRGMEGGIEAAKQGHDVIMAPITHTYFNMYQSNELAAEPLAAGGFISVEKVYSFEPIPEALTAEQAKHVLGAQGNLWSEYVKTPALAEYMVHPRLQALAEVLWTPKRARSFPAFVPRLVRDLQRLDLQKVAYGRHIFEVRQEPSIEHGKLLVKLAGVDDNPIHYTLDGSAPGPSSPRYHGPITLTRPTTLTAVALKDGKATANAVKRDYVVSLGTGKPVVFGNAFSERYPAQRGLALSNGIKGSNNFGDGEWLGFNGVDLDATLDLGSTLTVSKIEVDFLRDVASWILLPKHVELLVSGDGKSYRSLARLETREDERDTKPLIKIYEMTLVSESVRYVRVRAKNHGALPTWHAGKGNPAWLFVSEISVR